MKKLFRLAESGFTVASLVLYSGGPLVVILSGGISEGERVQAKPDFVLVQLIMALTYVISVFLLLPILKRAAYLLLNNKLLLILIGIAILSIIWSAAPELTLRRAIALVGTSIFGIYIAARYSLKQQLHLLGWAFGSIIVLSIIFALLLPQYGIMGGTHGGLWRGIYNHKNTLGAMMLFSTVIFGLLAADQKIRLFANLGLSASICLLVLSGSSSALVNLVVILIVFPMFRIFRWQYTLRTVTITFLAATGITSALLAISNIEPLFDLLGKDLTFTGRTELWSYAWEMVYKKPWLGYGYQSLWFGWNSETADIWKAIGWNAPNAHNGFLDLLLDLGFVGMCIFLVHFLNNLMRMVNLIAHSKSVEHFLPLLTVLLIGLCNLSESVLMDRNSIYWVFYVSASLASSIRIKDPASPPEIRSTTHSISSI